MTQQFTSQEICNRLAPYLTDTRQERITQVVTGRLSSIHLALEATFDPHNAAAVLRSCEGFGILHCHIIAAQNPEILNKSVTQGCHQWLKIHFYDTFSDFICQLAPKIHLAGACVNADLSLSQLPIHQPLCLLLGNEKDGLSAEAKAACHLHYQIPMDGMSESFNLSVAAGISLYDVTKRKRDVLGKPGDLDQETALELTAEYYKNSVQERLLQQLLK